MKRWIKASAEFNDVLDCARFIQSQIKSIEVPFEAHFNDGSTAKIKFNCPIKQKSSYCFLPVSYNFIVSDEALDFKQQAIEEVIEIAKDAYPALNIYSGRNTTSGPRGYSDYGIYVKRQ